MDTESSPKAVSIALQTSISLKSFEHRLSTTSVDVKTIVSAKPFPYNTITC
jgi:hypothetical protein